MGVCQTKRIKKTKLCTGDLDKWIDIQTRTEGTTQPGESTPTEGFISVKEVFAGIETPGLSNSGVRYFNGVTIDPDTTHIFLIYFDPELERLEAGNHFILYDDYRYRILSIQNNNESDQYLNIQASNRGVDTKLGSQA